MIPASMLRWHWLGRIRAQAQVALGVFLVTLLVQYAALTYALSRNHALMRNIVEYDQAATKAIDALSEDLAILSYRILGVVGGIYAAPNIAHELRKLGDSIIGSWGEVRSRLGDYSDAETTRRAEEAIAALPAFLEKTRELFLQTQPAPSAAERERLEDHHDEWLDIRPALTAFTDAIRQQVTEHAASSFRELQKVQSRMSRMAGAALLIGLVALGLTWYLLLFLIARPVTLLVGSMRRIASGDMSVPVPSLDYRSEVGDMARAVQVFKKKSRENLSLREEEARRGAELARARDEAQAANRTKSEFLANMSHELRTPLNAIIGFSDAMLMKIYGPLGHDRYAEYARDIRDSGTHLLAIINDILDIAKIEAGRLDLRCERVGVGELFATCERLIRQRAVAAGVQLSIEPPDRSALIVADEVRLRQILLNLLSNAVKFTARGGQVLMKAERGSAGEHVIRVTDSGIGMSEAQIAIAMQPFRQIDNTLSRRYEGTGLGLPLTKALIELHGGTLALTSAPGAGTTATITLPASADMERRAEAEAAADAATDHFAEFTLAAWKRHAG